MAESCQTMPHLRVGARSFRGFDADRSHHAAVLVLQKVAMIDKGANSVGITEIHAQAHAWILEHLIFEERNIHRIAQKGFIDGHSRPVDENEMELMVVEGGQFG